MKDPRKHPRDCRLCGRPLPIREEPRGRARLYCPASVRPCKERHRTIVELQRRAATWEADGRSEVADRIRRRAAATLASWSPSVRTPSQHSSTRSSSAPLQTERTGATRRRLRSAPV